MCRTPTHHAPFSPLVVDDVFVSPLFVVRVSRCRLSHFVSHFIRLPTSFNRQTHPIKSHSAYSTLNSFTRSAAQTTTSLSVLTGTLTRRVDSLHLQLSRLLLQVSEHRMFLRPRPAIKVRRRNEPYHYD